MGFQNDKAVRRGISFFFFSLISLFTFGQSPPPLEQLRHQIETQLATQPGRYAVAFKDLTTGQTLLIHEREEFHAASTMKTPVMIEVYKQAAQKRFSLSDSILIKNEFNSIVDGSPYSLKATDDSDTLIYTKIGTKLPLSAVLYDMIILSSNLATNLIIERVDAKKVMQTMREMGTKDLQVRRGVEDTKAFQKGLNNTTTAYDLMVLFEKIATGKAVSPEASQDMIRILLDQRFNSVIPAKLPKTVRVAHKTGSITSVRHDSGIVFLPDGRKYVLVLLSKEIKNDTAVVESLATVSGMIYQYFYQ
ncbi:serine hydrolase [Larkinella humicola]|uniref:beta-lactamase n=1 Tax=Larkinella humicola TaxID=2607654 RepID=A0A5N1JLZ8_9BACT|nr:serine hydrolase [Larkinella humicola]KAA9356566.1 serine hydrolase [Larkinella humicola]